MLTGGAGADEFVYNNLRDAGDTITDFTPYADHIDLRGLLASLGVAGSNAIASGVVRLVDTTGGVNLLIDTDGNAGPLAARVFITLKGLTAAQIAPARDLRL